MQKILGREIRRAIIVDDDPSARDAYAYPIEELNLQPVKIPRLHDPKSFIKDLSPSEDVVVCDYHLKMHDYAKCNGDAFMAACYEANIPGVLCSTFTDFDVMIRRDYLRSIPVRLEPSELQPQKLTSAWEKCILELNGTIDPTRKSWRTLVRVEENDHESRVVYVVIPSWDSQKKVRIDHASFPKKMLEEVQPDYRFLAKVNVGAERHQDLFFDFGERT